ncbi:MAG TPA: efflux RND transporter periplasmic adaptor subunit [Anaerolineae bacterium]|nr:efflux RND transporter periplasmic adaptor subunit [Anaerolineae bacterium]
MRRWLIAVAVGMLIVLVGASGYLRSRDTNAQTQSSQPTTVPVTRGAVQQLVTASGKLVSTRQVTLSMGTSGQLAQVTVRPGDRVKQGQTLAGLDTTDLEQAVAEAEQAYLIQEAAYSNTLQPSAATVAAARAAVHGANAAYQAAKQKAATNQDQITVSCFNLQDAADAVGRARDAYEAIANDLRGYVQSEKQARQAAWQAAQNAYAAAQARCDLARNSGEDSGVRAAQVQLLDAQNALTNLISPTETSLITARADLESARLSLESARWRLSQSTIAAPFDGVVVDVKQQAGDMVDAHTAIVALIDPQALEVEASVAERDLALVQIGQAAQLLFDARPDLVATGHVERIVPSRLSGSSALYPVYLTFDQLPDGLAADMSVDISITISGKDNVLRLPRTLVHAKPDNTAQVNVWVEDHVEPRSIKTGLRGDVYLEIVNGLDEGDLVVSR